MKRLTKSVFEESVNYLRELTNCNYTVGYWNGFAHVYNKSSGEMLFTGTLRECKDAVDMFIMGYKSALER